MEKFDYSIFLFLSVPFVIMGFYWIGVYFERKHAKKSQHPA